MQMGNSLGFPQGTKLLRKEDHSGMIDCYISRVENNELHVKKKSPRKSSWPICRRAWIFQSRRFDILRQPALTSARAGPLDMGS